MVLKKHIFQHKYTYDGYYYKTTLPITSAFAITGHKSQGATISSKDIIDIKEAFAPGLAYVMLSRVTNRIFLKIIGNLQMILHLALLKMINLTTISCKHPNYVSIHIFSNL
jgi:ATP-dependent DNA helicase PIF1